MEGERSEVPRLYHCPFPSAFYKADILWPKSNSHESPWNFLNLFHILPGIGSEGKKWNIRAGECGAQSQRVTVSCPMCFLTTTLSDPWERAFPRVPFPMGFPHCFIPFPRKKKEKKIEFGEEVKVVFNGRETHKSSSPQWRRGEWGVANIRRASMPPFPWRPMLFAQCALGSKAPFSFLLCSRKLPPRLANWLEFTSLII